MSSWIVGDEHVGERLDVFLTAHLEKTTRSAVRKMIQADLVTINAKPVTVHQFLKKEDKIHIGTSEPQHRKTKTADVQASSVLPPLKIIEETADWLVIYKPAGLLVHPDTQTHEGTLVDLLLAHSPAIAKVGEKPEAPGIVHRLDREVSGLMIIAKTQTAYESLQKQFAGRQVEKKYLALVHGALPHEFGDIKFRIARSTSQARMAARPIQEKGRAAWTHYRVLERLPGATLTELQIFSGRTHQIRAHLFALGHPVMGDKLYKLRRTERTTRIPQLMLQSVELAFHDPHSGERRAFILPPDPEFARLLRTFGSRIASP